MFMGHAIDTNGKNQKRQISCTAEDNHVNIIFIQYGKCNLPYIQYKYNINFM